MASQNNTSRNQANQRRARALEARETKASTSVAKASSAMSPNARREANPQREERVQRGGPEANAEHSVLRDAKEQVEQIAHQATDMASNAGKVTAKAVTRATRATGEALGKAGEAALALARTNPVPLALAGIGVACAGIGVSWLIASHASGGSRSRQTSGEGKRRDGDAMSEGMETIKSVAHDATEKVSGLAQRAGAKAMQLEEQLETVIKEHPIAAGATLLAVGAAIGLAVPRTAIEDSWIGHERDRLMAIARDLFHSVMDKGKALAEHVMPEEVTSGARA